MVAQKTSLFNNTKREKSLTGFTILEVILAIFILTVAVFSSYALIEQTIRGASLNRSKLVAYYFAQKEIENVKNQRDNNWLNYRGEAERWKEGISNQPKEEIYFLDGASSGFERKITIDDGTDADGNRYLEVEVTVYWSERGRDYQVKVINYLYNWLFREET